MHRSNAPSTLRAITETLLTMTMLQLLLLTSLSRSPLSLQTIPRTALPRPKLYPLRPTCVPRAGVSVKICLRLKTRLSAHAPLSLLILSRSTT